MSDNQRLEVDAFVRYHIADPLLFYQSVFDTRGADAQLGGMLNSALRRSSIGGLDHRHRARQARRADGRHPRPDDRGRQALRPRRRRRAHQARRSAGGELGGGVPSHADRTATARRLLSRARVAAEPADQGGGRPKGHRHHRRGSAAVRARSAARATASATASSPRPMARTPIFSASTARCRPMRTASPTGGRGRSSVRSRTSSATSRRRTRRPRLQRPRRRLQIPRLPRRRTEMATTAGLGDRSTDWLGRGRGSAQGEPRSSRRV